MLSSNRLVSAFKPWEPVCNDGHSVENAIEHGELNSVKCITEGIATVSLSFRDPIEDTTSGIDEQTSIVTTSMKRTKLTSIGSNDKHLKPSKKSKVGVTSDDPSVSSVGKNKEVSNSQEAITSDQTFDNIENLPHGKKTLDKSRKGVELNRPLMNSNSARKNGKLTVDVGGGTDGLTKETSPESGEKENGTKDLSTPVVIGLQCKSLTYSRTKKQQPGAPLEPETTGDVEVAEVDTNSSMKRRRGRPRKLPLKTPETSLAVNHQNKDAFQDAGFVEGSKMNASIVAESVKENPEVNLEKSLSKSSGKALTVQHEKPKIVKGRRGKRRTISSINIEASPQDFQDSSKQKANEGLEKDGTAGNLEKSFDTMSDDQPLSRWFEGMHSATTVDSTVTTQQRKVEQLSDASKKQLENLEITLAVANGDGGGKLSFVKSSPLWETLESMEVFRMIPQNPHFRPLNSLKDSAREGQAISQMVNFSKVVENTSRLRADGPRNAIEECLEVLVELEIHGFDVKLIRNRLTGLLLIKDKQEELEARWKEVEDKMERENVEGKRDDEEIEVLDKKIRELLERRSQVLLKKEKKGSEVSGLEVEVDGIKEGLNEIRRKFDGLAAASLCPP